MTPRYNLVHNLGQHLVTPMRRCREKVREIQWVTPKKGILHYNNNINNINNINNNNITALLAMSRENQIRIIETRRTNRR